MVSVFTAVGIVVLAPFPMPSWESIPEINEVVEIEIVELRSPEQIVIDMFGENSLMYGIASCESSFHQFNQQDGTILRGKINSQDIGIFQINEKYWLQQAIKLGYDIYIPEGNVQMALWIYENYGTKDWNWSKKCWELDK